MNGSSTLNYPINEQLIGKFHVINVDKIHSEELIPQTVIIPDESGCASRFQVDRNFGCGQRKVNDYEPTENMSVSTIPSVSTIENESINMCNDSTFWNVHPLTVVNGDSNIMASAAFQQQQRMALNNTATVVSTANVPPPTGFIHGYPPSALTNQSYLLSNPPQPQFGYYHFYPPPYSHYAPPWAAAALAAPNPYLQPQTLVPPQQSTTSQLPATANHNDSLRSSDTDNNGENTFFNHPLQNAQFAAYLYALQHSHSPYLPQTSSTASSYATIPSFHPVAPPPHPTILPPQNLPLSNTTTDIQQSHQPSILISPKHEETKSLVQQSSLITPITKPLVTTISNDISNDPTKSADIHDLISSSPGPPTLISPIDIFNTSASSNIRSYTTASSSLKFDQTEAVNTIDLINHQPIQNMEITNDILKELKTPTKQNK